VFDDPDLQAKYKTETGKDLRVPQTWEEYNEVATFFSGWDWDGDGEPNFGSAEVTKRDERLGEVGVIAEKPGLLGTDAVVDLRSEIEVIARRMEAAERKLEEAQRRMTFGHPPQSAGCDR